MVALSPEKKAKIACLDIHAQKTFTPLCPDELPTPGGHLIVDELNAQASFAAKRVGAKEAHNPKAIWVESKTQPQYSKVSGKNVDIAWKSHSIVGTYGFELIDGLPTIDDYDYYIWQGIELDMHPYGVCFHDSHNKLSTGIIEFLRQNDITTVILGGLATDYCVKTSVLQLRAAGFRVIVNLGACRGIADDTTTAAINEMQARGAEFVNAASELPTIL